MTNALFSTAWAVALGEALRSAERYRQAAAGWEGSVVLEWSDAPANAGAPAPAGAGAAAGCGVFLDLQHGECHAARMALAADYDAARFILSADLAAWTLILDGGMAPTMAILRGKLKVKKGSVGALMLHANAASELVHVAQGIGEEPNVMATPVIAASAVETRVAPTDHGVRALPLQSTSATGLRFDSFPMRLWDKGKRLGVWNPADIDFTQDRQHWLALADDERDMLLRLTSLFQAGEECVTLDILPLLDVVASEGRLEEQLYLTSFLFEEAKHVEAFRRFFDQVAHAHDDLTRYHTPSYRTIFAEALPTAMGRLRTDRSPVAQARASVTYNMIVEGVLAETGYHVYHRILVSRGIMPGMQQVAALLKLDESRHLAYGMFLLSRLVVEHGDPVWDAITQRMNELVAPAVAIISEAFAAYPADRMPFDLKPDAFVQFAMGQFEKRMERLERARHQSIEQIHAIDVGVDA